MSKYLEFALNNWLAIAQTSILVLLEEYITLFKGYQSKQISDDQNDLRHYYVSYVMSLIHISPQFTNGKFYRYVARPIDDI
jgi:hypothetical protein